MIQKNQILVSYRIKVKSMHFGCFMEDQEGNRLSRPGTTSLVFPKRDFQYLRLSILLGRSCSSISDARWSGSCRVLEIKNFREMRMYTHCQVAFGPSGKLENNTHFNMSRYHLPFLEKSLASSKLRGFQSKRWSENRRFQSCRPSWQDEEQRAEKTKISEKS